MQTVYYVRHGESEGNVAGVTSGAEHDCDLTDEGRRQARQAGQDLKDKHIDLIVCSPMKRTIETAQLIAAELGYDAKDIVTRKEFIERFMGIHSRQPYQEFREAVQSNNVHDSLETPKAMRDRVKKGLDWIQSQSAQNIVLVSHGGTGRIVKIIDQDLHHDDMYKLDGFGNTEIYEFTL